MTDQDLLMAYVHRGDVDSLGAFFARYQTPLLRFAARLLGNREAAQDVVQETFLEVARKPKPLLKVRSCHNWLLRVTRNRGIDHVRKATRHRRHQKKAAARQAAAAPAMREAPQVRALERTELFQKVRGEIEELKPRDREIVLLRLQEGKSYREIAEITGLTPTHVGYLLHHAMKDLARRTRKWRAES